VNPDTVGLFRRSTSAVADRPLRPRRIGSSQSPRNAYRIAARSALARGVKRLALEHHEGSMTTTNRAVENDAAFPGLTSAMAKRERSIAAEKPLENAAKVVSVGRAARDGILHQTRLLAAGSFFVAAALAITHPDGARAGWMALFLLLAAVVSVLGRVSGDRRFIEEIERAGRAQGLSEQQARRAAVAMRADCLRGDGEPQR
jgi:hypothetical protein